MIGIENRDGQREFYFYQNRFISNSRKIKKGASREIAEAE